MANSKMIRRLQSRPTTPGADRGQVPSAVQRYPEAFFLQVAQPFPLPMDDPTLFQEGIQDFETFSTGEAGWAAVLTDTGTATIITTDVGGVLQLTPSDGSVADNDEAYVGSEDLGMILIDDKKTYVEARLRVIEGATDDQNVIFGLSSTYAANTLQDAGAGPPANYSGAVFFKLDGGTVWNIETSLTSAQSTEALTNTVDTGEWVRLGIYWDGVQIQFYIDGLPVGDPITATANIPTAALGFVVGHKNGAITTVEYLDVDYIRWIRER